MKYFDKLLAYISIGIIKFYQYTISPDKGLPSLWLKGKICMHKPHCSQYSIQVLKRYGFFRGLPKAMHRVTSCTGGSEKKYDPDHYKVVFFSGAPIGVPFLQTLKKDKRFEVVGVVTMPDKPSGRGMKIQANIVKQEAEKLGISNIQTPTKLNPDKSEDGKKFYQWLKKLDADFLVVIAYGKIIPQNILDLPKIAPINVHGSLLPRYRGASPIQSVFLNNDSSSGITIIKMVAEMDAGPMIDKLITKIPFDWTARDLIAWIQTKGPKFLNKTLRNYAKNLLGEVDQNKNQITFCSKLQKEDGEVDPYTESLQDIYNKYRAFALWPKIFFYLTPLTKGEGFHSKKGEGNKGDLKRIVIEEIKLDEKLLKTYNQEVLITPPVGGEEIGWFRLNQAIISLSLKPEGKKTISRQDFVSGYLK